MTTTGSKDLRKWVEKDGFGTEFRMELAEDADDSTESVFTASSNSASLREEVEAPLAMPTETQAARKSPKKIEQINRSPPKSSSTPAPEVTADVGNVEKADDCITSTLDSIRDVQITVSDVKAEIDALNSKWLLRELEHQEIKVNIIDGIHCVFRILILETRYFKTVCFRS